MIYLISDLIILAVSRCKGKGRYVDLLCDLVYRACPWAPISHPWKSRIDFFMWRKSFILPVFFGANRTSCCYFSGLSRITPSSNRIEPATNPSCATRPRFETYRLPGEARTSDSQSDAPKIVDNRRKWTITTLLVEKNQTSEDTVFQHAWARG